MNDKKLHETISLICPKGHHLRGNASFVGKTVKCPRCQTAFVVSAPEPKEVTDSSVMEILGDGPAPLTFPEEMDEHARPCPRCGVAIAPDSAICEHCKCYVGMMPRFMNDMVDDGQIGQS